MRRREFHHSPNTAAREALFPLPTPLHSRISEQSLGCTAVKRLHTGGYRKTMSAEIESKVKEIIVEQLSVNADDVKPDAKFIEDLGADSLDLVELIMAFEEEFELDIPDEEAEKIRTVGDAINYLNAKKG
jgi:acyl carrier protein